MLRHGMGWCAAYALSLCVTVVGLASPAAGAEDPEALIREGVELRRQGKDARAEGYFRRAYQLASTPRTAAQLGLVELAIGEFLEAETRLTEALSTRDAWVAEHRKTLEDSRAIARKKLFRVELTAAPAGVTYAVDGAEPRALGPDGLLWLMPDAPTTLRIAAPGRAPVVLHLEGRAGESRSVALDLPTQVSPTAGPAAKTPPVAAEPPVAIAVGPPEPPPPHQPQPGTTSGNPSQRSGTPSQMNGLRIGGVALAATGLAAGIVGGIFCAQGNAKLNDYRKAVNSNGQIPWNPEDENWSATRTKGVVLLAAGGVAILGGAALFLLGAPKAAEGEAHVSFIPGAGLGVLSYRGTF